MGRRRRKSIKRPRSRREHRLQGFFILQKRNSCITDTRLPSGGILELLTSLVSPIQQSRAHNARAYARRGARAKRSNETPGDCRGLNVVTECGHKIGSPTPGDLADVILHQLALCAVGRNGGCRRWPVTSRFCLQAEQPVR